MTFQFMNILSKLPFLKVNLLFISIKLIYFGPSLMFDISVVVNPCLYMNCNMLCLMTPGGYAECACPDGVSTVNGTRGDKICDPSKSIMVQLKKIYAYKHTCCGLLNYF